MMLLKIVLLAFIFFPSVVFGFFDPVTWSVVAGVGFGAYKFDFFKDQTYCRMTECCNERYIPGNIAALSNSLRERLYGQHIVVQQVIPALRAHFSPSSKSTKPLVISFHGTPGTGKNFVSKLIAEALYKEGLNSKYVHKYMGRADFPNDDKFYINQYKTKIRDDVSNALNECARSLFIFDEVDKMPVGLFGALTSLIEYHRHSHGQDNTKAMFIFLSNTAGGNISDRLAKLLQGGTLRDETKLSDFEQILEKAAYNLDGGLHKTSMIEAHVIDHYIPFLPLEKAHVYKCLQAEYRNWGRYPDDQAIEEIIANHVSYDRSYGLFATAGCKTLEKKVAVAIMS